MTGGETAAGIDFSLEPGGTISGVITDTSNGQPVENMRVVLHEFSTGMYFRDARTLSDGSYFLAGVPAGSYRIQADCYGTNYIHEYYSGTYSANSAQAVTLTAGQTRSDIHFSLETGESITGTVTDSGSGLPVEGIIVEAKEYTSDFWVRNATTQSDGAYTLTGIPPGGYRVVVSDWQGTYAQEYYNDTVYWSSADRVDVVQGQQTSEY